jgi:hypothetical protein
MLVFPRLWLQACRADGRVPEWIQILRNPLEVATSIKARNGIPRQRGYQIWLTATLSALELDLVIPSKNTVFYDEFITAPWETVEAIRTACGLTSGPESPNARSEIENFVSNQDRHHRFDDDALQNDTWTPGVIKDAWTLCRAWPSLYRKERTEQLESIINRFHDVCLLSGPIIGVAQSLADLPNSTTNSDIQTQSSMEPDQPTDALPLPAKETPVKRSRTKNKSEPNPKDAEPAPLLFHYHLFKNAGTSVDEILSRNFGRHWVEQEFNDVPTPGSASQLVHEFLAERPGIKAVSSHTARLPAPELAERVTLPIIFVRHPIDRLKSAYNFEREQYDE